MKHAEFMTAVKSYYGSYENKFVEEVILKHILTIPELELGEIYKKLINTVPRRENLNPVDISRIQSLFQKSDKDYEAEALTWWSMVNRTGNSLDDVIISDIRAQSAIEDMGGWTAFCQRDPESEHFHQAKFIKWFVMYSHHKSDREIQILIGDSTKRKTPLMFGDKELCKQFLQLTEHKPSKVLTIADEIIKEMRI